MRKLPKAKLSLTSNTAYPDMNCEGGNREFRLEILMV